MRLLFALWFLIPTVGAAQSAFPTEWPSGAEPLAPDTLRQKLIGKNFFSKSLSGSDVRTQYEDTEVTIYTGNLMDWGKWRIEGSSVCVEWRKIRPACSEIRIVGDTLYVKRANNGEIMTMVPK